MESTSAIDLLFVSRTAQVLELFGPPDRFTRRPDGFAYAYRAERAIPPINADPSERNDCTCLLYSRSVETVTGQGYLIVVCAKDLTVAKKVESLMHSRLKVSLTISTVEIQSKPRHHRRRRGDGDR